MKKWFKLFGALIFFAGCFMLLGSQLGMTGNVISEETGNLTSILSIIVIIGGILGMMVEESNLEKEVRKIMSFGTPKKEIEFIEDDISSIKSYKRQLEKTSKTKFPYELVKKGYGIKSIRDATLLNNVSLKDAINIYDESNKKVESGEWVKLGRITVRDTNNPSAYPQATSSCIYWGPENLKGSSNSKLKSLYEEGKIGKVHELVRGSDKYKLGGSLSKGTVSIPPKGSRVLERHWEIDQMYDHKKN